MPWFAPIYFRGLAVAVLSLGTAPVQPVFTDPPSDAAVKGLVEKLRDKEEAARREAIQQLANQGKAGRVAVPALIALLKTSAPQGKEHGDLLRALERLGVEASFLPVLVADLGSEDEKVAGAAVRVLGIMGKPALAATLAALKHKEARVRMRATQVCLHLRAAPTGKVVAALAERLKDDNATVRLQAALTLGGYKAAAVPVVPALIEALRGKNAGAARALGQIGPAAKAAVPALREALGDTETAIRFTLFDRSDVGKQTASGVTRAEFAAEALGCFGPDARDALPDLVRAMTSPLPPLRVQAGIALSRIDSSSKNSALALAQLLLNFPHTRDERTALLGALARMDNHATSYLVAVLRRGDVELRELAAEQLGQLGGAASQAVPSLASTLKCRSAAVRLAAARALGKMGPVAHSPQAIAALKFMAQRDKQADARKAAEEALEKIAR